MRLACPCCGALADLDAWVVDADARAALAACQSLPAVVGSAVAYYLGLFRKPGGRATSWRKVRRLAEELAELVKAEDIQWDGRRVLRNRPAYWGQAMQHVMDKAESGQLRRPLSNHNLLRAIAYDLADKAAEDSFRRKEEGAASGVGRVCAPATPEVEPDREVTRVNARAVLEKLQKQGGDR